MIALLLPWGCAGGDTGGGDVAHRYADALAAPDFDAAWALCDGLRGETRGDCGAAVILRFGRFDACERLDGAWREECRFAAAEAVAATGDYVHALALCSATTFGANCAEHVRGQQAMALAHADEAEAKRAWDALSGGPGHPNSELDFWRAWHRARLNEGIVPDGDACPVPACRDAGRAEVRHEVENAVARDGCGDAPPREPGAGWQLGTPAGQWAEKAWLRACRASRTGVVPTGATE